MSVKNEKLILVKHAEDGALSLDNFKVEDVPTISETELKEGEILIQNVISAIDPFLRGRFRSGTSYAPGVPLGGTVSAFSVAKVVGSKNPKYKVGDSVWGVLPWATLAVVSDPDSLIWLNVSDYPKETHHNFLHTLGMPGLTAYFGLLKVGEPKEGETVLISSASSTVGVLVAEIAKIHKLNVIGLTSTDEKIEELKKHGFDVLINYKTTSNLSKAIKDAAPKGIDIYFDNVGGDISDTVLPLMNNFGRVAICGAISMYNSIKDTSVGLRPYLLAISKRLRIQGFIVGDFKKDFPEGSKALFQWLKEGKISSSKENAIEGLSKAPQALIDLYENKFFGKLVLHISQ